MYIKRKTDVIWKRDVTLQAHRGECIQKGGLHVIFVAEEIYFCGALIGSFELNQGFVFIQNFRSI